MTERRRRLIEVAFPLEEVSEDARKDPYRGSPHPQTLHRWWARRPLSACRAFIYASLVDDPDTVVEREELLREVAELARWEAVRHPEKVVHSKSDGGSGLTGTQLLERARQRILDCNDGMPPRLLDPFAGGGAIPLEGMRLGCEVVASDLNPVAVLILKGTIEYPHKFGRPDSRMVPNYILEAASADSQLRFSDPNLVDSYRRNPLATDVRYWGNWLVERAREELAEFYPPDADGSVPVAYLWSRTIPCPSCKADMPLIRQFWLARRDKLMVALEPVVDSESNKVDFEVAKGAGVKGDPTFATTSRGDTKCVLCGQVVKVATIRELGKRGLIKAKLTSVVTFDRGGNGRSYRVDASSDTDAYESAAAKLAIELQTNGNELSVVPDEPIPFDPQKMNVRTYGMYTWQQLFNSRQLLTLTTFNKLVGETRREMLENDLEAEYADAVATYLGLAISRLSSEHSTLTRWNPSGQKAQGTLGLQALPMVWDYAEINPWGGSVGDPRTAIDFASAYIEFACDSPIAPPPKVFNRDAREDTRDNFDAAITDPPYYDSINYSDVSDFFYVWLKRSIGFLHTDLFVLPLTPKREQTVMNVYAAEGSNGKERKDAARSHYLDGMASAFRAMTGSIQQDGSSGVVFAHTDPDAWATLIEGLLGAGLIPVASWPIDTEMQSKVSSGGRANLKTSVWMACRKRDDDADEAFLSDVMEEMRPVIRERLLYFWGKGIRGADFFISAIGPALSVFGQHSRVLRPDGSEVSVRNFLDIVRRESTAVALEQVLHGADLGQVDTVTRQYVTWVWSYSRAPLDTGEAIALCLATGATYDEMTRAHSIGAESREKSKKVVRLRSIRQRAMDDDDLGNMSSARPTPLIDQLQQSAWLWSQNLSDRLATYRAELGETRWSAMRTLGQAVAECLPDGDDDRRIILGLLGSNVMASAPPTNGRGTQPADERVRLPGIDDNEEE